MVDPAQEMRDHDGLGGHPGGVPGHEKGQQALATDIGSGQGQDRPWRETAGKMHIADR